MSVREVARRRRARRVPVSLHGTLRGRAPRPATAIDLSLNGCLLRLEQPLEAGSIHDLELPLSASGALRAKARVTESSRDGAAPAGTPGFLVGLEFLQLSARDEAGLRAFLAREARQCGRSR